MPKHTEIHSLPQPSPHPLGSTHPFPDEVFPTPRPPSPARTPNHCAAHKYAAQIEEAADVCGRRDPYATEQAPRGRHGAAPGRDTRRAEHGGQLRPGLARRGARRRRRGGVAGLAQASQKIAVPGTVFPLVRPQQRKRSTSSLPFPASNTRPGPGPVLRRSRSEVPAPAAHAARARPAATAPPVPAGCPDPHLAGGGLSLPQRARLAAHSPGPSRRLRLEPAASPRRGFPLRLLAATALSPRRPLGEGAGGRREEGGGGGERRGRGGGRGSRLGEEARRASESADLGRRRRG